MSRGVMFVMVKRIDLIHLSSDASVSSTTKRESNNST